MRSRHRPGFLRVVDKISLREIWRLLADDLDGIFVGAHRSIGAQTEEHGPHHLRRFDVKIRVDWQRQMRDIIHNAHCKAPLGIRGRQFVEHRLDHGRRELFAGQAIAATEHQRQFALGPSGRAGRPRLHQRGEHILIQGFTRRSRFLGAIQNGDSPDLRRQSGNKLSRHKRPVQSDDYRADLFPALDQVVNRFRGGFGAGTHQHHHPLGLGMADIFVRLITPAGALGEALQFFADDFRQGVIERIGRLASLKKNIRILGGAAHHRGLRRQGAAAVGVDPFGADQDAQIVIGKRHDAVNFVRGAETVKEMQHRHAAAQRDGQGHGGLILGFLHIAGGQHGETGGATGHHIRMIAENRQGMGGHRAGGHVHDEAGQLAGDLVHIGNHQQQALGRSEGGAYGSRLQRAVHGADGSGLALHLQDARHAAEDILLPPRRHIVGRFAHRTRGRNRIKHRHFAGAKSHVGDGFVAVES